MSGEVGFRPYRDPDYEAVSAVRAEAFRIATAPEAMRTGTFVAERDGRVLGVIRSTEVRQYFGGRPVPAAAVGSVAVAAEARGAGIGRFLNAELLRTARTTCALAVLLPTTLPVYRSVGYELAGGRTRYTVDVRELPLGGPDDDVVESWTLDDLDEIRRCHESAAREAPGLIERPDAWWRQLAGPEDRLRLCVRRGGIVRGYVVARQVELPAGSVKAVPGVPGDHLYSTVCEDLQWLDRAAARSLLGYFAAGRALGHEFSWYGPPGDPVLQLIAEPRTRADDSLQWMLRVLRVEDALSLRGYRPGVDAAVTLAVSDQVLAENDGFFRVVVASGTARVERVPSTSEAVGLGIGTLAALYSGGLAARDASRLGLLETTSPAAIDRLGLVFDGRRSWFPDSF